MSTSRTTEGEDRIRLDGFHAIKHAIRFGAEIRAIYSDDLEAVEQLALSLAPDTVQLIHETAQAVTSDRMKQLTPRTPHTHVVAFAARPKTRTLNEVGRHAPIVVLDDPRNAGNIGAVIRVAAGMGASAVATIGGEDPWHVAALRGSAGLHFAIPVIASSVDELANSYRNIVGFDADAPTLGTGPDLPDDCALIFGSERAGLSSQTRSICSQTRSIMIRPGVSSYNLATATAIGLHHWRLFSSAPPPWIN
jgi:TrmH family RNA methyltransferase